MRRYEHYREAESIVQYLADNKQLPPEAVTVGIRLAQVHATLATADATTESLAQPRSK